jgi:hypothetical protein
MDQSGMYEFKKQVIAQSRKTELFAKTLFSIETYFDLDRAIEWIPEEDNILRKFIDIPPEEKIKLMIPYPFEEHDENILIMQNDTIYFANENHTYVFATVEDNKIVIRHYHSIEGENAVYIIFYAEVDFKGNYFCRHYFRDGFFQFGKDTIFGKYDLGTLQKRVFSFNCDDSMKFLKSQGKLHNNARHVAQIRKMPGMDTAEDDADEMFMFGLNRSQAFDAQDFYGNY